VIFNSSFWFLFLSCVSLDLIFKTCVSSSHILRLNKAHVICQTINKSNGNV
jgi:hypothetical protein